MSRRRFLICHRSLLRYLFLHIFFPPHFFSAASTWRDIAQYKKFGSDFCSMEGQKAAAAAKTKNILCIIYSTNYEFEQGSEIWLTWMPFCSFLYIFLIFLLACHFPHLFRFLSHPNQPSSAAYPPSCLSSSDDSPHRHRAPVVVEFILGKCVPWADDDWRLTDCDFPSS